MNKGAWLGLLLVGCAAPGRPVETAARPAAVAAAVPVAELARRAAAAPGSLEAWRELGWARLLDGEAAEARAALEKAAAIAPDARTLLGLGLIADEEGRFTAARDHFVETLTAAAAATTKPASADPWAGSAAA